jgi:hypothetical protein
MIVGILVILFLFWLAGYGPFTVLHLILFKFNGFPVTIWDVLIFLVLIWLIGALPSPFRQIAVIFVLLWILSLLGIIFVTGLSSILVIAIIVGVLLYVLGGGSNE